MGFEASLILEPVHDIHHIRLAIILDQENRQGPWLFLINSLQSFQQNFLELGTSAGEQSIFCKDKDFVFGGTFAFPGASTPTSQDMTETDFGGTGIHAFLLTLAVKSQLGYREGLRNERLESLRVEVSFFDGLLVVVTSLRKFNCWRVHFNSVQEVLISILGNEKEVGLATGFGVMTFRVLDNRLHQFDILRGLDRSNEGEGTLWSLPGAMGIFGTQAYGGIVDREFLGRCGL
jgi:hypothetical protein